MRYSAVLTIAFVLVVTLASGFSLVQAQGNLCNPATGIGCLDQTPPLPSGTPVVTGDIVTLLGQVARFLIIISTIIAVIFIVWGGITWMTAGADAEKQKSAKGIIKNGIIGAVIVLAVGVIMQTIAKFVSTKGIIGS